MTTYNVTPINHKNAGIGREWSLCAYHNVERTSHDHGAYDRDSDLNMGNMHISIKASAFTLMSATLCEGLTSFDEIWNLYESKTHSNTFAYVTADYTVYQMNLDEFKTLVYTFCYLDRESAKNGGGCKIRCRKETKKMLNWLAAQVAC